MYPPETQSLDMNVGPAACDGPASNIPAVSTNVQRDPRHPGPTAPSRHGAMNHPAGERWQQHPAEKPRVVAVRVVVGVIAGSAAAPMLLAAYMIKLSSISSDPRERPPRLRTCPRAGRFRPAMPGLRDSDPVHVAKAAVAERYRRVAFRAHGGSRGRRRRVVVDEWILIVRVMARWDLPVVRYLSSPTYWMSTAAPLDCLVARRTRAFALVWYPDSSRQTTSGGAVKRQLYRGGVARVDGNSI